MLLINFIRICYESCLFGFCFVYTLGTMALAPVIAKGFFGGTKGRRYD